MLAVLIVNYNIYSDTLECVESLRNSFNQEFKIFVLDNASKNESYEILKEKCADCVVIRSESNLGFGAGNNKLKDIAQQMGFHDFLLLNSDTIVEPDMIDNLLSVYDGSNVAAPRMMYYSDKNVIWYAGGRFSKLRGMGFHEHKNEIYDKEIENHEITFVTGCSFLISSKTIDLIDGLFDDNYFMYYEDVDCSYRLLKSGVKMLYVDDAVLYHKVSRTTGGANSPFTVFYSNRNRLYFLRKHKFNLVAILYFYISRFIKYRTMDSEAKQSMKAGIEAAKSGNMGKSDRF